MYLGFIKIFTMKGATVDSADVDKTNEISIHAPVKGATFRTL